jgi:hypothetical protein
MTVTLVSGTNGARGRCLGVLGFEGFHFVGCFYGRLYLLAHKWEVGNVDVDTMVVCRLRACCGQVACLMHCSIHGDQLSLITHTFLVVLAQWNKAEF